MPSSAQLASRGHEIKEAISKIMGDDDLTAAQKSEALDKIQPDWEAHVKAVQNSERVSEMQAKLGGGGSEQSADEIGPDVGRLEVPNLKQMAPALGRAIVSSDVYREIVESLGGRKGMYGKRNFDKQWEVSLKASDAASNLMGEGLFGTTGPTAAGQSPFLPGAFGPGILPHFIPGVVEQRFYPLTIADLFTSMPTDSPDVTYLVESTANFNAAQVAEAGTYPFSSEEFSRVYEQIGKLANAAQVTDEIVRDAPFLFGFLQRRVIEGIQRQEEVQLLAGAGYPGVNGLLNRSSGFSNSGTTYTASNVQFPAPSTSGAGAQSLTISTLTYGRQAVGTGTTGTAPDAATIAEAVFAGAIDIQTGLFFTPNAILVNPLDWHTIRTGKDANGQYYAGSFFGADYGYTQNSGGQGYTGGPGNTLWGFRVVQTPAIPKGTILVGYFGPECANTIRREGISMQMSNEAGNNFTNGEVTIRAEERLGLAVYRPKAFELIELVNAP